MSIDGIINGKVGRPKVDTQAVNLRLPRDILLAIDNYCQNQGDLPTRPEAIRRMLAEQLAAKGYLTDE